MKNFYVLLFVLSASSGFSQNAPIDFETGGNGVSWTWATFEAPPGENDPTFSIVANPSVDATNNSATVAKIVIDYGTTESWGSAGCESMHGADIGNFAVTTSNNLVKMMIYQEGFAAPVALKYATNSNAAYGQVIVNNTIANAWVEVEFDMSEWIGGLAGENPDQIIFFPSHAARGTGHTVYFDNVTFSDAPPTETPTTAAPTPTQSAANVISVFSQITATPTSSSHYNDVTNTDFNPFWGSNSGNVVIEPYSGDLGLNYPELDFQGTLVGGAGNSIDVSSMTYLHFDYWTDGGSSLRIVPVSVTSPEIVYDVFQELGTLPQKQWVSVEVPLSHFAGYDFNIKELKFDQGGFETFHFDNIFFTNEATLGTEDLVQTSFKTFPNPTIDSWTIKTQNIRISTIRVFDLLGKNILLLSPNTTEATIDGASFKAGLYFAQIKTETGIITVKLIKK